jgi:hypothetical protein
MSGHFDASAVLSFLADEHNAEYQPLWLTVMPDWDPLARCLRYFGGGRMRRDQNSRGSFRKLNKRRPIMSIGTILIIILVIILVGALPTWPYSSGWGYYPSGIAGLIVLILLIMLLTGRL